MTFKIKTRKIILVEGDDDEHFIKAILRKININENTVQVINSKGDLIKEAFPGITISSEFSNLEMLGIIQFIVISQI